ncbi:MAG: hypothetical protein SFY32_07005 [Bacteroidota bacterium]|nr:hypothetical protein [Bacteroidota bacterium]
MSGENGTIHGLDLRILQSPLFVTGAIEKIVSNDYKKKEFLIIH